EDCCSRGARGRGRAGQAALHRSIPSPAAGSAPMLYTFGDHYILDLTCHELRQHGRLIHLEPRVFDCLAYLVQHPDRMVAKEELMEQLWPQQFVADESLTTCVAQVRKALGDTGQTQRYIQTIRRRGYRFIAPVTVGPLAETEEPAPAEPL